MGWALTQDLRTNGDDSVGGAAVARGGAGLEWLAALLVLLLRFIGTIDAAIYIDRLG